MKFEAQQNKTVHCRSCAELSVTDGPESSPRRGGRSEALLLFPRRADYARRLYPARRQDCHPNAYAEGSETEGTCRTHGNQRMHSKSSRPRFLARNVKRNPTTGGKLRDLRASRQQATARDAAHAPGSRPTVGKGRHRSIHNQR